MTAPTLPHRPSGCPLDCPGGRPRLLPPGGLGAARRCNDKSPSRRRAGRRPPAGRRRRTQKGGGGVSIGAHDSHLPTQPARYNAMRSASGRGWYHPISISRRKLLGSGGGPPTYRVQRLRQSDYSWEELATGATRDFPPGGEVAANRASISNSYRNWARNRKVAQCIRTSVLADGSVRVERLL